MHMPCQKYLAPSSSELLLLTSLLLGVLIGHKSVRDNGLLGVVQWIDVFEGRVGQSSHPSRRMKSPPMFSVLL